MTWLFLCLVLGTAIYFDRTAEAQCVQNGTTVTCTGSLGSVSFTAPAVRTLNVGSLTSTATWVSLTGTGSAPGAGGDSHFTCTPNPADCDITIGVNEADTCEVKNGAPAGTECVATGAAALGPTGDAGPTVTISVDTGAFLITPGASAATVFGRSRGSNGGAGGNAYGAGTAGNGASGANGGNVTVVLDGNATPASGRAGIVAASLAGDGGNGGYAYVTAGGSGSGGLGGFGGDANASHLGGTIVTTGKGAVGVGAFSQGGNGGDAGGGFGIFTFTTGDGGSAGQAGAAQVFTGAGSNIVTSGDYAYGILAQSLGGGGGSGSEGFGLFYSGAGGGSTGGAGGLVTVNTSGTIVTHGRFAHGILAQSIGGGGGDAGEAIGLVALGADGAGGGAGRDVSVSNAGSITTFGFGANAIEAQSIGGGGGNGSGAGGLVALGGNGAGTSTGGTVVVANFGALTTSGERAVGILAQSIGGGGGNGGTTGGLFAWGGTGGAGANADDVTVFNGGNIRTGLLGAASANSHGILVQSIGGGGGNGGGSIGVDVTQTGVSAAFGGSGGQGGNGKHAQLLLDNPNSTLATGYTVETFGARSHGVMVQSIGGGGGNGGFASSVSLVVALGVAGSGSPGGTGGLVDVATKGTIITHQDDSMGIIAQSIGGGGGNGGFALTAGGGAAVSIGGAGGTGGASSAVTMSSLSSIATFGDNSHGILAQSIGGGGGNGGFSGAASLAVSVGVGGKGGGGGASAPVTLSSIGSVSTLGDNAMGVAAQSLGGGGGNGGFSAALGVGVGSVTVAVGGEGANGGIGAAVNLFQDGLVTTAGSGAPGIVAQSIGGGGGNGGGAFSFAGGGTLAVAVGVGGKGGGGAQSGAVTVVTDGAGVLTMGDHSPGIRAQSIGGGGGNGGFSMAIAASVPVFGVAGSAAVAVGGSGGSAGNADTVFVNSTGALSTSGAYSHGIEAQSLGGGGGNGGFALSGAFTLGQVAAGVAVGGSGNGGGTSDTVTVIAAGAGSQTSLPFGVMSLQTHGTMAHGILAQSVGGGGGNGGFAGALGVALGGASGGVGVGGKGGGGATSEVVDVTSYHNILTTGDRSIGILAQSIGGGGGNGGFSMGLGGGSAFGGAVSVGGSGAGGSNSSSVFLKSYGTIATLGVESHGVFAQSIGGGGGNGGASISGTFSAGPVAASVAVGGSGAGGGDAGVEVNLQSYAAGVNGAAVLVPPAPGIVTLVTGGAASHGLFAQSIGGGGGNGGLAGALAVATGGIAVGVPVGGSGAGGGDGGLVRLTSAHNIATFGERSMGIFAQSIGGGGGNGGFSLGLGGGSTAGGSVAVGGSGAGGGNSGSVYLTSFGTVATHGLESHGIFAQSIGGGGGNGGSSIAGSFSPGSVALGVAVGGSGAGGGSAGLEVVVNSFATSVNGVGALFAPPASQLTLSTQGDSSNGVFAQSIGGGGGNGGFAGSAGVATGGFGVGFSVGGNGGGGGDGGTVFVNSVHNILTNGAASHGILAQSIGGGGGNGGFTLGFGGGSTFGGSAAIGGYGDTGGSAANVTATSRGVIRTMGDDSHGVAAQSLGGGGGNGGFAISGSFSTGPVGLGIAVGGEGAGGGVSGAVVVNSYAVSPFVLPPSGFSTLVTEGDRSNGILAQSIGGGGGNGGFSIGGGGATGEAGIGISVGGFGGGGGGASSVDVNSAHNVLTNGLFSNGILAQSIGGGGGNGGFSLALGAGAKIGGSASVGGFGDVGGNAAFVTASNNGTIWTKGDDSNGILAQSLGGGGGNGGFSIGGAFSAGKAGLGISVGGFGAGGGSAESVIVNAFALGANGALVPPAGTVTLVTEGDRSAGILAQSIGGGGGNGGFSAAGGFATGDFGIGVSVGGFGAGGGGSGSVQVSSAHNIFTDGLNSHGILAQSLGGGGGNGGFSLGLGASAKVGGAVSVGGFALGGGGNADFVQVDHTGTIRTGGIDSHGIVAQSIGGGGGNGGAALSGSLAVDDSGGSVSVGGKGSNGGLAGAVTVNSNVGRTLGELLTIQTDSGHGIFAQSIGGGGGSGGLAGSLTLTGSSDVAFSVSVGGFGGTGNAASTVNVTSNDNILTIAKGFAGIFAQSIGGGGGDGGMAFAGTLTVPEGKDFNFTSAVGGKGGSGANSGIVTVTANGHIRTRGDGADGVIAQSLGGGGGNGRLSVAGVGNACTSCPSKQGSLTASVGGFGGAGGAGADATLTFGGTVVTTGDEAVGLRAQSIGGGGGNGGIAISGAISGGSSQQFTGSLGGFGGAGSEAGNVIVTNTGDISTGALTTRSVQLALLGRVFATFEVNEGRQSHGILAQSIGGGGGNGGLAIAGAIGRVGRSTNVAFGATVGGFGGSGGFAGTVTVTNEGQIRTVGHDAHGIVAQSIGGGGGNGGGAISGVLAAGNPTTTTAKPINVSLALGGFGGDGNLGKDVTVTQSGGISTFGEGSYDIFAQSIGGGGGTGGGANSISLMLGTECTYDGTIPGESLLIAICAQTEAEKEADKKKKRGKKFEAAIGGFGGVGNHAGIVTVNNHGTIDTVGAHSVAIKAQSIGGGGGSGGHGISGVKGLFPNLVKLGPIELGVDTVLGVADTFFNSAGDGKLDEVAFTLGGKGGNAGNGGAVSVTNGGAIATTGFSAKGIFAQSIGGGGGDGGESDTGDGYVSIGGFGGAAGNGGIVTIQNVATGRIITSGEQAHAIFGQSIGGGGGSGGSATGFIAIGGVGGSPQPFIDFVDNIDFMNLFPITSLPTTGHGGEVRITNFGVLGTSGAFAHGIVGQSIGGGGGELTGNGNGGGVGSSKFAIGGWGATSGDGGLVTIENSGTITTNGKGADAIRGQSVGGGGGNGGDTSGGLAVVTRYVSVGGQAGAAGSGGNVVVSNFNTLSTFGEKADGIFAQSIGGGGGDAGQVVGLVGLGGQRGGSAGNGGAVTVTNNVGGSIWTRGAHANGIYAQSVGGGGGAAGVTVNVLTITLPTDAWLFLGGGDGTGGVGGTVTVDNHAGIRTDGASSQGIFAQSVGGGGGAGAVTASVLDVAIHQVGVGGRAGGDGGTVNVTNRATGSIVTNGASSTGIFAQSVGGGGGTADIGASLLTLSVELGGGFEGPAILGGTGGSGGDGAAVTVSNSGAILVNGKDSIGIMAQSIGGGGGTARVFTVPEFTNPLFTTPTFSFTLGGTTGGVGKGGDVSVTNAGSITINGDNSLGIFAQSVGGGGGLVAPGSGVSGLVLAADGSGDGGTLTINNTAGAIILNGANSVALFSQSVGGGGGVVGALPTPAAALAGGGINAIGAGDAIGQIGGVLYSGSSGGRGVAGATLLNQRGHLIATGLNSSALVVQSHGPSGNGDITINILNAAPDRQSMIVGGTGTGAGVFIMNGARNQLNNAGLIGSMLGFDGFAVRAGTGDDRIVNTGTIIGSINLGTGANSVVNNGGATFLAGRVVELGGGTLTNEGVFSPGGEGRVMFTNIGGNFAQAAGGTFRMDLDLRSLSADQLGITGTSSLSGRLELNLIDPVGTAMRTRPGTNDFPIAMTTGGAGQTQLQLVAPNTAVATYTLVAPTTRETTLRSVVDFAPVGMSANARALGEAVNAIQTAQQSPSFGPLAASLFFQPNVATLGTTYESLGGAAVIGTQQASIVAADRFLDALDDQTAFWLGNQAHASNGFTADRDRALEAARTASVRSRTPSVTAPRAWRMWVTGFDGRNELSGNTTIGSVDTTTRGGGMVGGFDYQVSPRLLIGAAAGKGTFDFDASQAETRGRSTGIHVATYGAYSRASYYASGTLAFSFYENEVSRRAFVPGTSVPVPGGAVFAAGEEFPTGSFNSRSIAGSAEGGYRWALGHFELAPFAGVQFVGLDADAYTETASGSPSLLGMTRVEQTTSSLPTFLGAQWKVEGDFGKDKVLSVFVRGSWKHELRPARTIESGFNAAPDFRFVLRGAEPFEDALRASLGVRQTLGRGLAFFAQVDGEFAGSRRALAGSAGLRAGW